MLENRPKVALNRKTVISVIMVAAVMLITSGVISWMAERYILTEAEERVRNLLLSHKGIHHYVQNVLLPAYTEYQEEGMIDSAFYAPELLSSSFIVRIQHQFYNNELVRNGYSGVYYKLAAKNPRNPLNIADSLETAIIENFNRDRTLNSYEKVLDINGEKYLYVAIPFLENTPNCMRCHGDRNNAPVDLQRLYPGEGGFNESPGEIRAITSIRAPLEHEYSTIWIFGLSAFSGSVVFAGLIIFNSTLRRSVAHKTKILESEVEERKKAENILSENQAMLRQILDTTPQAIFWKDKEGVYVGCNRNFALAAGLNTPADIIGKTDMDLPWSSEGAETYRTDDLEVMTNNRSKRHIIEPLKQADGNRIWIDTTKVPLHDTENRVTGVLGVYEDITEKKRAEEEKRELEKRLQHAQKMEAIGTLTGGIAHDFNNILAALFAYSDLAKSRAGRNDPIQELFRQMDQAHSRAANLVKQLLAFSRKQDHSPEILNVNQYIRDLSKMLNRLIGMDIEMRFKLEEPDSCIYADPVQLEQILINLVVNARDAVRENRGEGQDKLISITTALAELRESDLLRTLEIAEGNYLRISVEDNGYGIAPEHLEHIFEPFFTTKEVGAGTGLGLATIYGIIRQNHASITVDSEPGRGTRFDIYWPLSRESGEGHIIKALDSVTARGNETILYVEDEELIRAAMSIALKELGYKVNTAGNGAEAMDMINNGSMEYDLIITDITMPKMGGRELINRLLEHHSTVRIIACSGHSGEVKPLENLMDGEITFLQKPFSVHNLAQTVRKVQDK